MSNANVTAHTVSWQEALSDLVTDPNELLALLELDSSLLAEMTAASLVFPLKVPRSYLARIEKGNPRDPLLKQILPIGMELKTHPDFVFDPLEEAKTNILPGLLHKYHGRVLITLTGHCAIHCRYCFRRHFPYAENNPGKNGLEKVFDYIAKDTSLTEVILSGGDPLAVNDNLLHYVSNQLNQLSHIKRLRIHTRLPVVLPERITDSFISWLNNLQKACVMVLHVNHPQEINQEIKHVLFRIHNAQVTLLNQAVLLKGVNDNLATLIALSEKLFEAKVLPYYLHVLDKVQGAAHFDLELTQALRMHESLRNHLPGYLVPRLVQEEAGKLAKTPLL